MFKYIGCIPDKTQPCHTPSNGISRGRIQTVKMGLKVCCPVHCDIENHLSKLLLSCRAIPHAGRRQSPPALIGRQIRVSIFTPFATNECMCYIKEKNSSPEKANFVMQKGVNTVLLIKKEQWILAREDQYTREHEIIEKKWEEETEEQPTQKKRWMIPVLSVIRKTTRDIDVKKQEREDRVSVSNSSEE